MAKKGKKKANQFTGDYKEKNLVSHKFIEAFNKLKQRGVFDTYEDFSLEYGYGADVMAKIAGGVQDVPLILLWAMVDKYGVNADFFFLESSPLKINRAK
ncbi:MAG: hypothetical protein JST26_05785 [Bacteroidetes bacterium]|nr:hypothetical protein [Bacteroidota bacterium]